MISSLDVSLSIIIPVYNEEKYLKATLGSVSKSELNYISHGKKLNITISNNGSTDKSREIIEAFSEKYPHWKIINSSSTISGDDHFNSLIRGCTTEFICIVGGHDLVSHSYFYELEDTLKHNPKSSLCFGQEYMDEAGTGEQAKKVNFRYKFSENLSVRFWQSIFYLSNATCIQGVIRTRLLQDIDAHTSQVSDLVWLHGLLKSGAFVYTNNAAYIRTNPIRPKDFINPKVRKLTSPKESMSVGLLNNWRIKNVPALFFARIMIRCKFSLKPYKITIFRLVRNASRVILPAATGARTVENRNHEIYELLEG